MKYTYTKPVIESI